MSSYEHTDNPPSSPSRTVGEEAAFRRGADHSISAFREFLQVLEDKNVDYDLFDVLDVFEKVTYQMRGDGELHPMYMKDLQRRAANRFSEQMGSS